MTILFKIIYCPDCDRVNLKKAIPIQKNCTVCKRIPIYAVLLEWDDGNKPALI